MGNSQSKIYNHITGARYPIKLLYYCDLIPTIINNIFIQINNNGIHFFTNEKHFLTIKWFQVVSWHIENKNISINLNNTFKTSISFSSNYSEKFIINVQK